MTKTDYIRFLVEPGIKENFRERIQLRGYKTLSEFLREKIREELER